MFFSGNGFNFELGKRTYVMGILNVTKDSFSDGGKYNSPEKAEKHVREMLAEGADIIDIGAQSTRPDSILMSPEDELNIVKQYLPLIHDKFNAVYSIDTFYPEVAEYALNNGVSIINDVSGKFNPQMAELVSKYDCGWIIMHTGGGTAKYVPEYKTSVTEDVINFFDDALEFCNGYNIPKERIVLDIGIGFGKNYEQNIELIKNINKIKREDVSLLTALSFKRVVSTATDCGGDDRLFGTISANVLAVVGGTDFVRVHNVKENLLGVKMADAVIRR